MSDIVERLKKVEAVERELAHECDMPPEGTANWEYAEACAEAAAEIERLRAALRKIASNNQQRSNCFCGACIQARAARAALGGR